MNSFHVGQRVRIVRDKNPGGGGGPNLTGAECVIISLDFLPDRHSYTCCGGTVGYGLSAFRRSGQHAHSCACGLEPLVDINKEVAAALIKGNAT